MSRTRRVVGGDSGAAERVAERVARTSGRGRPWVTVGRWVSKACSAPMMR